MARDVGGIVVGATATMVNVRRIGVRPFARASAVAASASHARLCVCVCVVESVYVNACVSACVRFECQRVCAFSRLCAPPPPPVRCTVRDSAQDGGKPDPSKK